MGYDDRDYYRERPRLELTGAMGRGTLTLLIIVAAGFFMGSILSNTLTYTDPVWFASVRLEGAAGSAPTAPWFYALFVLTDQNVAPWATGFHSQPWKVLTSWLVSPSLIQMVFSLIGVFFIGRAMEQILGAKRLLLAVFTLSAASALLAALADATVLRERTSVIMGVDAALMGLITPFIWLYPKDQRILSFPARSVIVVLLVALISYSLLTALATPVPLIASPTQPLFAVLIAGGVTWSMNRRGLLARFAGASEEDDRASWGRPMYRPEDGAGADKDSFFVSQKPPVEDDKARQEAEERKQVDALLEKISRSGIGSLSRAERKFLDNRSKKAKK